MPVENLQVWADETDVVRLPLIESQIVTLQDLTATMDTVLTQKVQEFDDRLNVHTIQIGVAQAAADAAQEDATAALTSIYNVELGQQIYTNSEVSQLRLELLQNISQTNAILQQTLTVQVNDAITGVTPDLQATLDAALAEALVIANDLNNQLIFFNDVSQSILDQTLPLLSAVQTEALDRAQSVSDALDIFLADYPNIDLLTGLNLITNDMDERFTDVEVAQTGLQANIDGVTASLNTDYLTATQTQGEISAALAIERTQILSQVGADRTAELETNYYTQAQTDLAISSAQTSLSAELLNRSNIANQSDFTEDGLHWTGQLFGEPNDGAALSAEFSFQTVDGYRVAQFANTPIASNRHLLSRRVINVLPEHRYRVRILARCIAGAATNIRPLFFRMGDTYNAWASGGSLAGTQSLPGGSTWTWLTFDYIAPITNAPIFLRAGLVFLSSQPLAPGPVQIRAIEFDDVSVAETVTSELLVNYYTEAETDSAISAAQTTLQSNIDAVEAYANATFMTSATTDAAIAVAVDDLSADIGGLQASLNIQSTAIADIEGNAASSFVLRQRAGDAVGSLEAVAATDVDGTALSGFILDYDFIRLDGRVSMNDLVITDLSGNLAVNGNFSNGDLRGWNIAPSGWTVVGQDAGSGTNAIRTLPGAYALAMPFSATTETMFPSSMIPVTEGDRISVYFEYAAGGTAPDITLDLICQFFNRAGTLLGNDSYIGPTNYGSTSWDIWSNAWVVAPADAAYLRVAIRRVGGGSGTAYITNIRLDRQRNAAIVITPNSITGAQLITTEALISNSAQIGNLTVQSANIANLTVGTGKIANSAVTGVGAVYGNVGSLTRNVWTNVAVLNLGTLGGNPVHVTVAGDCLGNYVRLLANGVAARQLSITYRTTVSGGEAAQVNYFGGSYSTTIVHSSTAGNTQYILQAYKSDQEYTGNCDAYITGVEYKK